MCIHTCTEHVHDQVYTSKVDFLNPKQWFEFCAGFLDLAAWWIEPQNLRKPTEIMLLKILHTLPKALSRQDYSVGKGRRGKWRLFFPRLVVIGAITSHLENSYLRSQGWLHLQPICAPIRPLHRTKGRLRKQRAGERDGLIAGVWWVRLGLLSASDRRHLLCQLILSGAKKPLSQPIKEKKTAASKHPGQSLG